MLIVEIPGLVSFEVEMRGMITALPSCKAKTSTQYADITLMFSDYELDSDMLRR